MLNVIKKIPIFFLLLMVIFSEICLADGKEDTEYIVESFKEITQNHIVSYQNDERIIGPYFINGKDIGGDDYWCKQKTSVYGSSIDVKKTNSLMTPYEGILIYNQMVWICKGKTKEEVEASTHYIAPDYTDVCKIVFSYQDGKWIPKTYSYRSGLTGDWADITPQNNWTQYQRMVVK